jgi:Na+/pantothenate symporter
MRPEGDLLDAAGEKPDRRALGAFGRRDLLVPVVGGLYLRRAGSAEALASIVAGNATLLIVRFALPRSYAWIDPTVAGLVAASTAFAAERPVTTSETLQKKRGNISPSFEVISIC